MYDAQFGKAHKLRMDVGVALFQGFGVFSLRKGVELVAGGALYPFAETCLEFYFGIQVVK